MPRISQLNIALDKLVELLDFAAIGAEDNLLAIEFIDAVIDRVDRFAGEAVVSDEQWRQVLQLAKAGGWEG